MSSQMRGIAVLVAVALAFVLAACQSPDKASDPPTIPAQPMAELEGTEWLLSLLRGNEPEEGVA